MISLFSPPAGGELCEAFCTRSPERFLWVSLSKKSRWAFSPSCFPNCKINFCIMILQFCRCGGLFDAKGNPDGFLSHYPSLRNFRLSRFFDSLKGMQPHPLYLSSFPQDVRQWAQSPLQPPQPQPRWCSMCQSDTASHAASSASTAHSSHPMRQVISSRS